MSLRSVASMSSGAMMFRFDWSAVSVGRPKPKTVEAGAAAGAADAADAACDCDRVCRDVACRFAGAPEPCDENTGFLGEGESKVWGKSRRDGQCSA
eukprot:5138481-Pleurochrysis_carterae.AAC.1